ncbi:MAG: peptide ABC transporter substrate-binding protein [Anaerolineaceae bacterium]|jgi:oligopeptide transport system substrate-binding protein|nr:peptide ABC transporter substrate-binding protein [Anaerolineaceae bacterium]
MSRNKTLLAVSLFIITAMVLAACQPAPAAPDTMIETVVVEGEGEEVIVVVEGEAGEEAAPAAEKVLRLTYNQDFPTIDPSLAWDVSGILIIDETTVGLTRQNEQTAENELAMATDYVVADDGVTFTFTIRDDVPWVRWDAVKEEVVQVMDCEGNPRMVTADDFVYGIRRTMTPATAADYAYVQGAVIQGAEAFSQGETDDFSTVGVKALDAQTLEVKFIDPAVYNLSVIGLWFNHAMPEWLIEGSDCTEGRGDRWIETGFFQGYGPFTLKEWIHDSELTIVKNPFWPGDEVVPTPQIDVVTWKIIPTSSALAEFEAGNLDVAAFPAGDYDRIMSDPDYSQWLYPTSTLGTEFYSFNTQLAPTDDVRVRQALSMAIDREALVQVMKSGIVANWFCNPGASGCPTTAAYPDLGVAYDPEGAKALLQEYLDETGQTAADLNIVMMFNTSEGHKMRAEAVQQMWKDNLGVEIQLTNQEWAVFKVSRKEGKENVYRSSWVQDYPDANNFLKEVFSAGGAYADVVDWNSPEFDELMTRAGQEADPMARMDLYAQAEQILVVDEAVVSPLAWYSDWVIIRPEVKAFVSLTGYDRYEKWTIE